MTTAILTRIQYVKAVHRAKAAEFDLTLTEVSEFYPAHSLVGEWWAYVEREFNAGADFTAQAVRGLTDGELRSLSRTTRGLHVGLPRYYLTAKRKATGRPHCGASGSRQ